MFGFSLRDHQADIAKLMRRVCDLTTPNNAAGEDLLRAENRYNRVIPVLVCPYCHDTIDPEDAFVAITKDVSDQGVGLVLNQQLYPSEIMLAFWLPVERQPWFLHGCVRRCDAIGGGFWVAGVELLEVDQNKPRSVIGALLPLAEQLLPATMTAAAPDAATRERLLST